VRPPRFRRDGRRRARQRLRPGGRIGCARGALKLSGRLTQQCGGWINPNRLVSNDERTLSESIRFGAA